MAPIYDRLNGWQRVGALTAGIWLALCVAAFLLVARTPDEAPPVGWLWGIPVATLFTLGYGVAWVRRGFTPPPPDGRHYLAVVHCTDYRWYLVQSIWVKAAGGPYATRDEAEEAWRVTLAARERREKE